MISFKEIFKIEKVYAHCDIPCGIYDPHTAQVSALTVLRMMDLIKDSSSDHDLARYVAVKEEHAELCKHEIRVIWGDYFKDEHIEENPKINKIVHHIMSLASKVKQTNDRGAASQLLEEVNNLAEIFWGTKGIKTKKIKSPYKVEEEIVIPDL